ncbi:MAG: hypothetical protein CSA04_04670 [Bacteroidetes bacterium]|nr:MAG: hypothetical protein CSA04_04670 [Bacteroidota bacterium]
MDIFVFIISITIVVSKFFDCWTTSTQIKDPNQERNPIARYLFVRYGSQKVIWGIFGLTIGIVGITLWLLFLFYNTNLYKLLYGIIGIIVTMIQLAVAHTNKTKKPNFVTRFLIKRYSKYR